MTDHFRDLMLRHRELNRVKNLEEIIQEAAELIYFSVLDCDISRCDPYNKPCKTCEKGIEWLQKVKGFELPPEGEKWPSGLSD